MLTDMKGFNEKVVNEINASGNIVDLYGMIYDIKRDIIKYSAVRVDYQDEVKQ